MYLSLFTHYIKTGSNEIQVETNVISVNIVELVKRTGFDNIRLGTCAYEK